MTRWLISRLNLWVVLASLAVAGGLIALIFVLVSLLPPPANPQASVAVMTVIPAPTMTPTVPTPVVSPTPTAIITADGITIGVFVQVSGTEGAGLRIRSGPGTSHDPLFLGMDAEVFQVKDGPREADGFTWWFLEAPYDPNRSGWAASAYLSVLNQLPTTPTP